MNEKIHIRRTAGPVRTPRITAQSSNGYISPSQHIPFVSQQKNVLPILPSQFDTSKIISINHSFHLFTDNVAYFLSHNGCIGSYRGQISQNSTELERLFNSFYQAVLKYSSQKNCQSNPTIRSSGISFLKNWQLFALSILDLKRSGPGMIAQSINAHFNTINSSLKTVMNNGISKSNVHDQSYRNGRVLQNQLNLLKASANAFLEKSNNSDNMKRLSSELKEFSRLLNETFAREFTQCGIAQNEVVRLRSKCYTACSDVIQGLKNSYLFQTNMNKLLQLLVSFQDNLKDLLEKFNLPVDYLISIDFECSSLSDSQNIDGDRNEEEEMEADISFDENLSLPEFIRDSQERSNSFIRNQQSGDKFFGILNTKVTDLLSEMSKRKNDEADQQKLVKDEFERLKRENKLLIQERKVFMDEADDLKIECENLKESINQMKCELKNNEKYLNIIENFRNSLKQIAKINDEIEDDSLISQALKIHNDLLINYLKFEEKDKKLKKLLNTEDIVTETEKVLNEIVQANKRMNLENDSIIKYKEKEKKLKQIFSQFSNLESVIDVANEISDSFKKLKHIVKCTSLSESVDSIYMTFSDIKEALLRMSNSPQNGENETNLLVLVNSIENEIDSAQKIIKVALNQEASGITSLPKLAELMSSTHLRYLNGFKSILTILGQDTHVRDVDLAAIKSIQKVQLSNAQIIQKLKLISGSPQNAQTVQNEPAMNFLNAIEKRMNQDKETIDEQKKLCGEVEAVLTSYLNNDAPSAANMKASSLTKSIRVLLKKLPQKENSKNRLESEVKNYLKKIEMRLCKLTNEDCQDDKNRQDHIMLMIDKFDEFITSLNRRFGNLNGNFSDILSTIEKSVSATKSDKKIEEIDKLFEGVFDLVPVTSRSEPSHYIPEFCNAFVSLHNSVLSLKPFASILNQIFSQFDCKLQSFKPSSQSFQFIKTQIYNLHTALNNLAPSKVNSLVFLILSRFVALTSSFTAAISSASFDDGDPNMKETFFQMQMELCRNEKII